MLLAIVFALALALLIKYLKDKGQQAINQDQQSFQSRLETYQKKTGRDPIEDAKQKFGKDHPLLK